MNTVRSTFLSACLLAAALPAQDQATTLLRLGQRADVVVLARVTAIGTPAPEWRRLTMQNVQVFKGALGGTFALTEPERRCCGQGLFSLQYGDERILFLQRVGPTLHVLGGGRGVLPATAALSSHVQQLLQAPTTNAIGHLLADSLTHAEPRIAHDAAHALATLPGLQLTPAERGTVTALLASSAQSGSTLTAPLVDIAARLGDANMVDAMMPVYLNSRRDDQARLLRGALARCPSSLVAARLPVFVNHERLNNVRAARLLTDLPNGVANQTMNALLLNHPHPSAQLQLCEGLLGAGVPSAALSPMVHEVVLKMAIERSNRRPRFRNVLR